MYHIRFRNTSFFADLCSVSTPGDILPYGQRVSFGEIHEHRSMIRFAAAPHDPVQHRTQRTVKPDRSSRKDGRADSRFSHIFP